MLLKSRSNIFLAFVAISFVSVYGKSMLNKDFPEDADPDRWVIVNETTNVNQTNTNDTYVEETNTNVTETWKTKPPRQNTEPPTVVSTKPAKRKVLKCGKRHINQILRRQRAKIVGGHQAVKGAYPWQV